MADDWSNFSPGSPIPQPGFFKGLARRARGLKIKAIPPLYAIPSGGKTLFTCKPGTQFTGIAGTTGGSTYIVTEAQFDTTTARWTALSGGRVVTASEYNLATDIPNGSVVFVRYTDADDWRFVFIRSGMVNRPGGCPWPTDRTVTGTIRWGLPLTIPGTVYDGSNPCDIASFTNVFGTVDTNITLCAMYDTTYSFSLTYDAAASELVTTSDFGPIISFTLKYYDHSGVLYQTTPGRIMVSITVRCVDGTITDLQYFAAYQIQNPPSTTWVLAGGAYSDGPLDLDPSGAASMTGTFQGVLNGGWFATKSNVVATLSY